jgi:prepilin-type N-terminal cleavage/methylation domain-containing protein
MNLKKGFTLIEMLIVLVMLSLIGLAIFTTLSSGIRIWQRLNQRVGQEDVNIFFERIASELRNTFEFDTIKFQGEEDRVTFVTFVTTPGSIQAQETGIGEVSYFYDKPNRQLNKQVRNYSQIYKGDSGTKKELLKGIDSLTFSYYFYDQKIKEYFWQEGSQEGNLPKAVRIELEFNNGQQIRKIIRTIDLPVAQS